ncbi:unnamed protein product [Adineta steineri]|uniref:Lysozyme n=1 Tax=Adineta steineri TaxID=433720 RepID=A0A815FDR5_9BILA|nr:unnamed protein product [Adineta steineri]CAF1327368.1 unnamed protein product [Adineta steineri]
MFMQIFLISSVPIILATIGVDVSQKVSQIQFECLKDSGYKFIIVRVYRKNGIVDSNCAETIKNARAVGLKQIEAYFLPCFSCGDASQQVIETIDYLKDENVEIDRLWLNIEGKWNNNNSTDINIQFIEELIVQISNLGMKFGIFTSKFHWISIMNNITKFSSYAPLWYIEHDNERSFDDFQTFGEWRQPSMKQFIGDVKECGVILNKNFS